MRTRDVLDFVGLKLEVAFRNVLRNRVRTGLNVLMIAGSITAIILFRGFVHNLIAKLENVAINTEYGHVQMASEHLWNPNIDDSPTDRLMTLKPELKGQIEVIPGVRYVSGRLPFFGLISSGDHSLSARGLGFDPDVESELKNQIRIQEGRGLGHESKYEIIMGLGLQKQFGAKVGQPISLLSYTYDGAINALDAQLVGVFESGSHDVDDTTFLTSLATAQKLLDTSAVERVVVQLRETSDTDRVADLVRPLAPSGVSVRRWSDLATYYQQVVKYSRFQDKLIEWILMTLALISIANTATMSIYERTGEIGTIRALGDRRIDILSQFLTESLILGILGSILGSAMAVAIAKVCGVLKIPLEMPGTLAHVYTEVDLLPSAFTHACLVTCGMTILAALLPAYRASKLRIVDALKHNR